MGSQTTQKSKTFVQTDLDKCDVCFNRPNIYIIATAEVDHYGLVDVIMCRCHEHTGLMPETGHITREEAIVYQVMHG
jgi:hypothetical protein